MDWHLRDQLQCLDSEVSALLRPARKPPVRRCPGCVRPLRPLRIQVLEQCVKALGTRSFNWSQGLNRLQRRDLAEVVVQGCRGLQDPGIEELCTALQGFPWTCKNVSQLLLPAAAAPDLLAVQLAEREVQEECSFCESLVRQEAHLSEALLSLGGHVFKWSQDLGPRRRELASLVLECCRPGCFLEAVQSFCSHLERLRTELAEFRPSPHLESVQRARQAVYLEEKKALSQLQALLSSGHQDRGLRELEELLVQSVREAEGLDWKTQEAWTLQACPANESEAKDEAFHEAQRMGAQAEASAQTSEAVQEEVQESQELLIEAEPQEEQSKEEFHLEPAEALEVVSAKNSEFEERLTESQEVQEVIEVVTPRSSTGSVASQVLRAAPVKVVKPPRRSQAPLAQGVPAAVRRKLRLEAQVEEAMRRAKEQFHEQRRDAQERRKARALLRLQALARGRATRRRCAEYRERCREAGQLLQALLRCHVEQIRIQAQEIAATKMQTHLRGKRGRDYAKEEKRMRTEAATKIQAIMRGKDSRQQSEAERKAKMKAITKMQAVFRGQAARKQVAEDKQKREVAATKIQAIKRGKDSRQQAEAERKAKMKAITKMQAVFRGQAARKQVAEDKQKREVAATKIQAIKRGKDSRQQAEAERKAKMKAITKMQAVFRGQAARKQVAEDKQKREVAATKIQAIKRGKDSRQQAEAERKAKMKAVTKMQAVFRGQAARKQVAEDKKKSGELWAESLSGEAKQGRTKENATPPAHADLEIDGGGSVALDDIAATKGAGGKGASHSTEEKHTPVGARDSPPEADEEAKRAEAATKIQAVHRGRAARKEVASFRLPRANKQRLAARECTPVQGEDAKQVEAAKKIQSVHRGNVARKEVAAKRAGGKHSSHSADEKHSSAGAREALSKADVIPAEAAKEQLQEVLDHEARGVAADEAKVEELLARTAEMQRVRQRLAERRRALEEELRQEERRLEEETRLATEAEAHVRRLQEERAKPKALPAAEVAEGAATKIQAAERGRAARKDASKGRKGVQVNVGMMSIRA